MSSGKKRRKVNDSSESESDSDDQRLPKKKSVPTLMSNQRTVACLFNGCGDTFSDNFHMYRHMRTAVIFKF